METGKVTKQFSMTVSSDTPFAQEERDFLSQVIAQEIRNGADSIVDEVFESPNADEYIMDGDTTAVRSVAKAVETCFKYGVTLKEIH